MVVAERETPTLVNLHGLKMSWRYRTHKTEAGNNSHLRGIVSDNSKNFLARPVFSARYIVTQLDLPQSRMYNTECDTGKAIGDNQRAHNVDFNLYVILNPVYTSVRKARNVEEFKRAFLDCLESKQYFYFHITLPQLTFGVQVITIATLLEWCSTAISATKISCYTDQEKPIEPITKSASHILSIPHCRHQNSTKPNHYAEYWVTLTWL